MFEVIPNKVSETELECTVPAALLLMPGQFLYFENPDLTEQEAVIGEILAIKTLEKKSGEPVTQHQIRVKLLHGIASLRHTHVELVSPEELGQYLSAIQGEVDYALNLAPNLHLNLLHLNTLTVINGSVLDDKINALHHLIAHLQRFQRMVIIDPIGLFEQGGGVHLIRAGLDASLSLQSIGLKRFLSCLADMLPDVVRTEAVQILAQQIPIGLNFYPFKDLLRLEAVISSEMSASALKVPLLNCLYEIDRQRVFAESPREVFSFQDVLKHNLTVVDLASLSEPWKTLFYEEVFLELLANADSDVVPVLIYPENYISDWAHYIRKANEADMLMISVASPYATPEQLALANNTLTLQDERTVLLKGDLSLQMPITFTLPETVVDGTESYQSEDTEEEPSESQYRLRELSDAEVNALTSEVLDSEKQELPIESASTQIVDLAAPQAPLAQPAWMQEHVDVVKLEQTAQSTSAPVALPDTEDTGFDSILGSSSEPTQAQPVSAPPQFEDEFDFALNPEEETPLEDSSASERFDSSLYDPGLYASEEPASPEAYMTMGASPEQETPSWEPQLEPQPEETVFESVPVELQRSQATEASPAVPYASVPVEPTDAELMAWTGKMATVEAKPKNAQIEGCDYQIGEKVQHEKYGLGVVSKIIPMEDSVILNITFDQGGKRLMDPKLTQLEKV